MSKQIEFSDGSRRILFFVRGRGRGHAVPSLEIVNKLEASLPDVEIRLVSYGTGARTLEQHGRTVFDLDLPEQNPVIETIVLAGRLVGWLQPDLVVAHEEFSALPAARIFDRPAVFLTDWLPEPGTLPAGLMRQASEVLYLDEEVPEHRHPVAIRAVGQALRQFRYGRGDRTRARKELDLPEEGVVVSVLPGSWRERDTPIAAVVEEALNRTGRPWTMVWVAGDDTAELQARFAGVPQVRVIESDWQMDRLMAASTFAVTKANRKTCLELAALGIPFLSFFFGNNAVDERRVATLARSRAVGGGEASAEDVGRAIEELLALPDAVEVDARMDGAAQAAEAIAGWLAPPGDGEP